MYLQAQWDGPGIYALIVFGSTPPPMPVPLGTWKRAAASWEEVQKYNTLANPEEGRRVCFARTVSDLQVTDQS